MEKTPLDEKAILRREYRKRRSEIDPATRKQLDNFIAARILALPEIEPAKTIFAYLSRTGEVDTSSLVRAFLQQHKRVLTPSPDIKALPHGGLFRVTPCPDLEGHYPPVLCQESRVDQVDVVLVPGIAWDRDGYRIGFGGGYFDRLLSMVRADCVSIGLAYDCQLSDAVPREPWDEQVDILVTESLVLKTYQ
jgi:5-formyltetrahydrofolate cyclo-ligase